MVPASGLVRDVALASRRRPCAPGDRSALAVALAARAAGVLSRRLGAAAPGPGAGRVLAAAPRVGVAPRRRERAVPAVPAVLVGRRRARRRRRGARRRR